MKYFKYLIMITICGCLMNCVQDTHKKTITVVVDMTKETHHSKVGIRGNYPLSWEETTYLSDDNNDGIYEGEFEFYTASNAIQFKFVNHNDQFELNGQDNRVLEFEYQPEIIRYEVVFNNQDVKISKQ